jgi:hypothetical protein
MVEADPAVDVLRLDFDGVGRDSSLAYRAAVVLSRASSRPGRRLTQRDADRKPGTHNVTKACSIYPATSIGDRHRGSTAPHLRATFGERPRICGRLRQHERPASLRRYTREGDPSARRPCCRVTGNLQSPVVHGSATSMPRSIA